MQADHGVAVLVVIHTAPLGGELAGHRTITNHVPGLAAIGRQVSCLELGRADLGIALGGHEYTIHKIVGALGVVAGLDIAQVTEFSFLHLAGARIQTDALAPGTKAVTATHHVGQVHSFTLQFPDGELDLVELIVDLFLFGVEFF